MKNSNGQEMVLCKVVRCDDISLTTVCMCFNEEDATMICDALTKAHKTVFYYETMNRKNDCSDKK